MRLLAPVILALLGFDTLSGVLSLSDLSKVPKVINSGGGSGGKAGEDENDDGKQNMLNQAIEAKEPVYTYPMGLGNVLLNQCTEPSYTKTSPCYNSKLADLQNSICHNLMDAANYIGVGFDGRGYYRAESRKRNLVQRVCANKATFMGFDIPDTMNIFGIFETTAETKSFQSVSQYMRYVRHKAGLSNQKYLFKSEASKYSRASSRGVNAGIGSMIGATLGGVAGAAIGGAIGGRTEDGGGTGSGSQNSTDQGTSESKYTQDESSEASQGEQQHFFAMMFVNVILYEITLDEVKPTDLSLAALRDYMALPASYNSAGADVKYQNFLLRWGTHFIRSGKFGGQLKITKTLRADKSMTEDQFAIHAESEFKSMFSTLQSEYVKKETSSMKQQIRQSRNTPPPNQFSKTTVEAQGGMPEIAEALVDFYTPSFKQLYHDWLMSIKDFARLFEFQLRSIDEIFKMNMDDLFPSGSKDLGCIGGSLKGVRHFVEPFTNRRYYLDTRTSYSNDETIDEQVRVYCKYSDLEQFKTDMKRRIISLERALGVYMVEGPFPTSSFELPAGQPGCEETTLSVLHTVSQSSDKLTFAELKKKPFLIAFDMPREIPDIATQHAKYRMIYRDGLWFATDPRSTTMHLYDGCQLAQSELAKPKICFKNIILTYSNENGFFHIDPRDFMISKSRIPRLPHWLSGTIVARPKQLGSMREVRNNFMVSKDAVPCNVRWLNSHRLDPRRDENCIHFTAATEGDIFVVFASIPQDHHTWYYVQISPDGVSFYQGMNQQKSDIKEGMGVLGGENLLQSFFVCVLQNDSQVIMQYGKADPDSEIGQVLAGYTFPPRSQYSRLSFYSFGSGSKSVSLRDVRLTAMISSVICLNKSFHELNGHCVLRCHSECTGCTHADDNKACHQCKHARIEGGSGTNRVVECLSQCPAGNFLSIERERLCAPCPAGLFKDKDGDEQCSKCPIGTYSTGGAKSCTPCSPGKFNDNVGQSSCQMCAIGHFVAAERASTCSPCPFGKFASSKESTTCTDCPHGHYADKQGMSKCNPCASGSYAASLGQSGCQACPAGTNSSMAGSRSCANSCSEGQFSPREGVACQKCAPGTYADGAGSSSCTNCSSGTYQPSAGAASCITAPKGHYVLDGDEQMRQCTAGTYNDKTGQNNSSACKPCIAGSSSASGASSCINCSLGYYQPQSQQSTCLAASPGHYVDVVGSSSQRPCPGGRFNSASAGNSSDVCQLCDPGLFASIGSSSCEKCPSATYAPKGSQTCLSCPAGSYITVSACLPCPAGQHSNSSGSSKCTNCSKGHYASKTGSTSCTPCPLGHEAGSTGSASCTPCQPGKFAGSTGATQCSDCIPGTYAAKTATASCSACPAGQFAHTSGSTGCLNCYSGQFSNSGSATCFNCSAGTYAAQAGSAACSPCSATQVAPGTGSAACTTCPSNKYRFSATECKDCPDFSYNTVQPSGCYQYREVSFTSCQQESNFTYPYVLSCNLAMDGSLHQFGGNGTCCAHTHKDMSNVYWMGILGQTHAIKKIVIWGRHDYNNESRDIHISVWQDNQKVRECGYIGNVEYSVMTLSCNGAAGNRIKIDRPSKKDYLTLCEVKVFV